MTECIAPNEIESWQLDAYRDGVRDPAVVEHIRHCPTCAKLVMTSDPLESRLASALFRFTCPPVDDLMNYRWGLLSEERAAAVAKHLAHCPHCAKEAAQFTLPTVAHRAPQSTPSSSEQLRVFIARLLPKEPNLAPVRVVKPIKAGQRGPTPAAQSYTIDELAWDIVLNWIPGPGPAFTLQGQLFGPATEELVATRAELKQAETTFTAALDANGLFSITSVPPGEYTLYFYTPQTEIQVPNIKLI